MHRGSGWTQAVGKGFTEVVEVVLQCVCRELIDLLSILPDGDDVICMDFWFMENDAMRTIRLKSLYLCGRGGCYELHSTQCSRNT